MEQKGKKIDTYRVANKLIIIAPKKSSVYSKLKSIVPVILISGILAYFIAWYSRLKQFTGFSKVAVEQADKVAEEVAKEVGEATTGAAGGAASGVIDAGREAVVGVAENLTAVGDVIRSVPEPVWAWFLIGALIAILIFLLWNWKKL